VTNLGLVEVLLQQSEAVAQTLLSWCVTVLARDTSQMAKSLPGSRLSLLQTFSINSKLFVSFAVLEEGKEYPTSWY
jgi:hypothetical protein